MRTKKIIFALLIISIIISIVSSKEFDYDEFKEKPLLNKIKYIILSFFAFIEQYTIYFLMGLNVRKITEPYDFFLCFVFGCIFRIFVLILKKIFKSIFVKDNYVYNEPDNAENLYVVIKKLNEFCKNLKRMVDEGDDENNQNINNNDNNDANLSQNDLEKMKQIEEANKSVNIKLGKIEKCMNIIEQKYKEEKDYNEKTLQAIEQCQTFIKDALKNTSTEYE